MARTWRERVDRVKTILRTTFDADPKAYIAPNGDHILDDRLVNMSMFSKEARQAWREIERERRALTSSRRDPTES